MLNNIFGENLEYLRHSKGCCYTQKDLAEKLSCSISAISNYEKGLREPNLDTIVKISNIFQVSIDKLLKTILNDKNIFYY